MFTFLEKNHINILGDSYANKGKPWGREPGKKNRPHKGLRLWTHQNNKQKPEVLAAGEKT